MTTDITEKGLEILIIESLVNEAGYSQGRSEDFDRDHAVDLAKLRTFVSATQPKLVEALDLDSDTPRRPQFLFDLQGEDGEEDLDSVEVEEVET